ncbi:MAG: aminoacyl-tRNA hydrolase [Planctomycetota bacterium]
MIVGLGNPGQEYARTRHNAGFMAIDRLAHKHAESDIWKSKFQSVTLDARIGGEKVLLMKPTTFMNLSGRAVQEALAFYKCDPSEDLLVHVDEAALPAGRIKLNPKGSPGGHNGLADIDRALGGQPYARCRIGLGEPGAPMARRDFVLGRFSEEELVPLESALDTACGASEVWCAEGITAAMNRFNVRDKSAKQKPDAREDKTNETNTDGDAVAEGIERN